MFHNSCNICMLPVLLATNLNYLLFYINKCLMAFNCFLLPTDCWEKYQQPQIYRWYHPNGREWRGTKNLLMKVKEESENIGLNLNIQKTKIMASGAITSWQIDEETKETVTDIYFLGSKIIVGGDCSHEIKRWLLLGREAMTNLDSMLESRDITLATKICAVKAMVFPVVMYRCERWTIKKAEHQRIDAFELWCWRRLLRVPWTPRRSNQSILKEVNPEYSLEGLMLKLKLQYFGHLMRRADSLEKTLMLGKIEGRRRRRRQRMRCLDGITDSMDMSLCKLQGSLVCCSPWCHKELDMTEQLNDSNNTACRLLVPRPGIKPTPPAMEVWRPNHREVPYISFKGTSYPYPKSFAMYQN